MRRAKIVSTLGPASDSYEVIRALVEAGTDMVRLSTGDGSHVELEGRYARLRRASADVGRSVGVLADLHGPKVRLGRFREGPVLLERGDVFRLFSAEAEGDHEGCGTTHEGLADDVRPGSEVLVDEGRVVLEVSSVSGGVVTTRVVRGGLVSDHKGVNLPGVPSPGSALGGKVVEDLRWALRLGVDVVALSSVRGAEDAVEARRVMAEEGHRVPVIAKIEKPHAVEALEALVDAFDGIMVASGELGVEMALESVPLVQKRAVKLARRMAKPAIVTTQMLDSMVEASRPTRAEASDVANAVMDGADALMLSEETSVGSHPVEAVRTMGRIVAAAEEDMLAEGLRPLAEEDKPRTQGGSVARAAAEIGDFLGARGLVAFTQSGDTVRRLSRYRSPIPVLAFTPEPTTRAQLGLSWGVEAFCVPVVRTTDEMVAQVDEELLRLGRCSRGDLVVITAGSPPGVPGTTNLVRVHRIGEAG
ncbi:pyruvate kinase [Streptomyces sp. RKND-216]|uniref:pyruvate kinase n=1 Tax=Streptomyces sp. RKND-216 TaxID=2562581 RepID=UPI00109DFC33|nr:pyruvate kinase [Streptomyces sp. RKND-216]THA26934.1 pyruvate kinase [Streptomyces sp. RKND-216]